MEKDEFEKMCQKAGVKKEALCDTVFTRQFKKEVDKYIPDENKFSDYLKFCELYPKGDYLQFRKFCQEKKGEPGQTRINWDRNL